MRLQLDHAAPGAANARCRVSMVLVALAALVCAWQLAEMHAERAELSQQLEQTQLAAKPASATAIIQPQALSGAQKAEIKQANSVLDELGRPWPGLLNRLEQVAQPEIALLAIRPDAAKGKLRLKGEARDVAALLAYLKRLEAVPEMRDVVLDEHEMMEKPQDGGMANFIRFGITASWGAA
ncbi:PilN domain-containing protein [Methylobacillus arboreus]|uniref:PilN domain-containing protein n=1 Tax=Methylobacillus arboreus TaxID=755170 RepID=UPI001E549B28|nr:PilN domain-containing protein [Methylobacillus arboreus]MCB5190627.1 PilN domain-containing protein [Methylobacillus arboreus]